MKPRKPISRLTNPKILRQIDRGLLRRLLEKFTGFLGACGIELPPATKKRGDYDFKKLSSALLDDERRPEDLLLALESVGTMADVHGEEILRRTLTQEGGEPLPEGPAVPADIALMAYLETPDAFASALMEKQVVDTRSYRCFVPSPATDIARADFSPERMMAIEKDLSGFFGDPEDGCEIIPSGGSGSVRWYIVIHGGKRRREAIFEKGKREHVEFNPETDDVVRVNAATGEMWIHAKTKRESDAYRETFGKNLLGDAGAFVHPGSIFTLEPLRAAGLESLRTDDIEGCPIKGIELRQVEVLLDHANQTVLKLASKNSIFENIERFGGFPPTGLVQAAKFVVEFKGSGKRNTVKIRLPATADYERDSDSEWIEAWLEKRKFRVDPYAF